MNNTKATTSNTGDDLSQLYFIISLTLLIITLFSFGLYCFRNEKKTSMIHKVEEDGDDAELIPKPNKKQTQNTTNTIEMSEINLDSPNTGKEFGRFVYDEMAEKLQKRQKNGVSV